MNGQSHSDERRGLYLPVSALRICIPLSNTRIQVRKPVCELEEPLASRGICRRQVTDNDNPQTVRVRPECLLCVVGQTYKLERMMYY